jgi:hypothetical protein
MTAIGILVPYTWVTSCEPVKANGVPRLKRG